MLVIAVVALGVSGCAYQPILNAMAVQDGLASYYSDEFQGRKTSSGEIFDNARMTGAHRTYPFGTVVKVTNLETEQAVEVRINDRGPVKPERVIDLTRAAARKVGIERKGIGRVRIEVVQWGSK
jgi:rare lipoprotein A